MLVFKRILYLQTTRKLSKTIPLNYPKDPGVHHQRKLMKTSPDEDVEDVDFEEYETDFMNVHKSHKDHLEELRATNEREKYFIVKQKYFKEKYPNFLTWQDKQQIQYLYSQDPREWSIEKLSESFPALPEVISKIVKSKWTKRTTGKIKNHDIAVMTNWEDFKKGKFNNLPQDLKEHLEKFTSRSSNFQTGDIPANKEPNFEVKHRNVGGEFSQIITSYEKLKSKNSVNNSKLEENALECKEPTINIDQKSKNSKGLYTLNELESVIKTSTIKGHRVSEEDKHILKTLHNSNKDGDVIELSTQQNLNEVIEKKYESSKKVGVISRTSRDVSHLVYPERITIPKKLYKRNGLYKLNDCFYDSRGDFLYRVPGMC